MVFNKVCKEMEVRVRGIRILAAAFLALVFIFAGNVSADDVIVVQKFYAGSGDGRVYRVYESSWQAAHDASSGNGCPYNESNSASPFSYNAASGYYVGRSFYPFDTYIIPDDASIVSSSIYVFVPGINNDKNDSVDVVQSTSASTSSLSNSDYTQTGIVSGGSLAMTAMTAGQYNEWALNETGLGWINKTGYSKLAMRCESDRTNTAPTFGTQPGITVYWSEQNGTDQDPYLLVTYVCDENDVPESDDIISVTSAYQADYNGDSYIDSQDIIDLKNDQNKALDIWIKYIWNPAAGF
ncbi:MAG: hypothetical protein V1867_06185 [Candidatus Falkowbacteria bacterium]